MLINAIVCTYNRCESLRDTLRALKEQQLKDGLSMEILVVDNNSKDRTRKAVEEEAQNSPWPIRYVFEPNQGISWARNRGIQESKSDFLAFTDDDTIPEPSWALGLYEALVKYNADCVGGKILPLWLQPPPPWISHPTVQLFSFGMLGLLDHGPEEIAAQPTNRGFLYGANMGFRKCALDEVGLFQTELGLHGSLPMKCEDTEMVERLSSTGKKFVYTPKAVVHHKIPASRMRMNYVRSWNFFCGLSLVKMASLQGQQRPWRKKLAQECLQFGAMALKAYVQMDRLSAIKNEFHFWDRMGQMVGTFNV